MLSYSKSEIELIYIVEVPSIAILNENGIGGRRGTAPVFGSGKSLFVNQVGLLAISRTKHGRSDYTADVEGITHRWMAEVRANRAKEAASSTREMTVAAG